MKNLKIYIIIIFLISAYPLAANTKKSDIKNEKEKSHKTVFFDIHTKNCSPTISKYVNKKINNGLKEIPYLYLISNSEFNTSLKNKKIKDYSDYRAAAVTYAKTLPIHRIIIGSIERVKKKYYKAKGKTGKWQYLLKRHREDYFLISIEIIDIKKEKTIAIIKQKPDSNKTDLNEKIIEILEKIEKNYSARVYIDDSAKLEFYLSTAGSFMVTEGEFQNFSKYGGGAAVILGLNNLFVKNLDLQLYLGYYYIDEKKLQIDSFHTLYFSLLFGYSFRLPKNFRITPYIGFGYHFHFIEEYTGNKEQFYDPFFNIQCEFSYRFQKTFSVFISPGYNFFFEQKNIGRYFSLNVGFRMAWQLE